MGGLCRDGPRMNRDIETELNCNKNVKDGALQVETSTGGEERKEEKQEKERINEENVSENSMCEEIDGYVGENNERNMENMKKSKRKEE